MPATSKAQQQAAAIALSAKRGETDSHELFGAAKQMYDSMSLSDLKDFASTKHRGLPDRVGEEKLREYIRTYIREIIKETELNEDTINESHVIQPLTFGDLNARSDPKYTFFEKINEMIDVINDNSGIA